MFGVNWRALERRIGLRRDATRAPIRGPEWQRAAPMPGPSQTQLRPRRKQSLLKARNGLDKGVHFTRRHLAAPQWSAFMAHIVPAAREFLTNQLKCSKDLESALTDARKWE